MKKETKEWIETIEQYGWGALGAHDPTIIKSDKQYYMFSTDTIMNEENGEFTQGAQVRTSLDMIRWEYIGTAFKEVPAPAEEWTHTTSGLWAPEIICYQGRYYMYYSASQVGTTISCIGLAVAEHLDGPWEDHGIVIKTNLEIADHNAIDANVVIDREGNYWLSYGSFFGGLYIVKLNMETGFPYEEEGYGTLIAKRPQSVDTAIEGPFIYYHKEFDMYYLFTSYDSLNNTYNVRVARSKSITGPYVDMTGRNMIETYELPDEVGVKLLGSYQFNEDIKWFGPGHNSIYREENKDYMVHHVRIEEFSPYSLAYIREMFWLENGWPVVSPEYYQPLPNKDFTIKDLCGSWEYITFDEKTSLKESEFFTIQSENSPLFEAHGKNQFTHKETGLTFIVFPCKSWKDNKETIAFSGLTKSGKTIFGKMV